MDIKKTCSNCEHYHPTLLDPDSDFHIHDWCDIWDRQIPDFIIFDRLGYEVGCTDIECGITTCHAFEPKGNGEFENDFPELGAR